MKLSEALQEMAKACAGMPIEVTAGDEGMFETHWCGVIRLDANAVDTARAIEHFRKLTVLGAKDC